MPAPEQARKEPTEAMLTTTPTVADKDWIKRLMLSLRPSNERSVRLEAVQTLEKLGPVAKDAVPALVEALHDEWEWVRYHAAHALRAIGPEAKDDALLALAHRLEIQDEDLVRDAVQLAIKAITRQ